MLTRRLAEAIPTIRLVSRTGASTSNALATCHRNRSSIAHPSPSLSVSPIRKPLVVALTPPLKQFRNEPQPEGNVVILDPTVFNHPIRRDILHLCVVHHLDSLRQGSANTKTRSEVKGSGRKIRPQKGTGRARLGDAQSPMLVGGGIAFGPKPRDFSTKLPRKVIEMGMRVALSAKLKESHLGVMTRLDWPNGKTRNLEQKIDVLGLRKTLFITGEEKVATGLARAIRMLSYCSVTTASQVHVYELMKWERVVLDVKAVEWFEKTLGKGVAVAPLPLVPEVLEPQTELSSSSA
ncbi:50S ribosomal protein L4 [Coprinopsis marcescibilis]|uniref:Large ribosomal subunit protein uL4m n=1 Tax=Coprinopsis marcescibilis TaxID=230819 RepID=A0A5C3LCF6_COPMA|nr:50S ribosomal protein L4 [Coprinopsis marcescibilis]